MLFIRNTDVKLRNMDKPIRNYNESILSVAYGDDLSVRTLECGPSGLFLRERAAELP